MSTLDSLTEQWVRGLWAGAQVTSKHPHWEACCPHLRRHLSHSYIDRAPSFITRTYSL